MDKAEDYNEAFVIVHDVSVWQEYIDIYIRESLVRPGFRRHMYIDEWQLEDTVEYLRTAYRRDIPILTYGDDLLLTGRLERTGANVMNVLDYEEKTLEQHHQ